MGYAHKYDTYFNEKAGKWTEKNNSLAIINYLRIILALFPFFLHVNSCWADSSLTSIEFGKVSRNKYVIRVVEKELKQRLDKNMFEFHMDLSMDSFDKYSLINSLGWEFNNKIKNSLIFLNHIKYSSKNDNMSKLEIVRIKLYLLYHYFMIYEYLKAMDNYYDVSEIRKKILDNIIIESNENIKFIFNLIISQNLLLKFKFCAIHESHQAYLSHIHINDNDLNELLNNVNDYFFYQNNYCKNTTIYLDEICKNKLYVSKRSNDIYIINYPIFVYGKMEIFNNKDLILEKYCDGDDFFIIEKEFLDIGKYTILLTEEDKNKKYKIRLKIVD